MHYLYEIAGIRVVCEIPFSAVIQTESERFIKKDLSEPSDIKLICKTISDLSALPERGYWLSCQYHVKTLKEDKIYFCPTPQDPPYACVVRSKSTPHTITCFYIKGKESYLNYSRNICDILGLDSLLLQYNGFILHSSFIRWHRHGILFSAPSGTGKSTQADLWVKYEEAEVINGDRAGLRLIDGQWQAYGLPYAGSSGIYRNESASVAAVVILRQAKENRIRRLRGAEAIRYLYPEVTVHHWDREFVDQILNLLTELTAAVPVYLLECLPDRDAVELVKQTVF